MQKVAAMKSSAVQKRLDGSDLNRVRRSRRAGLNETDRKCRILEIRPLRPLWELSSEASRQTTNLPPISKCRTVTGKAAQPLQRKESAKPKGLDLTGLRRKDNTLLRVVVTQQHVAVQEAETCSRLNKQQVQLQRNEPCEIHVLMPDRTEPDAGLCGTRQHAGSCSDTETPSEDSEDEEHRQDSEEEYYTDQRITEWVLSVNSSLFSTEPDLQGSDPAEEQEAASINIIC